MKINPSKVTRDILSASRADSRRQVFVSPRRIAARRHLFGVAHLDFVRARGLKLIRLGLPARAEDICFGTDELRRAMAGFEKRLFTIVCPQVFQ
jgi:hypothetical protein